jgi:amino acid transporter
MKKTDRNELKKDDPGANRSVLEKAISFRAYVGLGLGAIIGMSWIVYTKDWLASGGSLGAVLGFVIGGLLLIPVGKVYAELTPALPVAGGEVAFSYKAFGPWVAFMSAWFLAFGYVMICPFETVALGWLLEHIIPGIKTEALYEVGGRVISASSILPGLLMGAAVIGLNCLGVKISARFQMVATGIMLLCVLTFALVAFFKGSLANLQPLFSSRGTSLAGVAAALLSVIVVVPFFMSGFDAIPQAAEESGKDVKPQELGLAVIVSIVMGICFYVTIILAVALCMPWNELKQFDMPTAQVFDAAFGYAWATKLVLVTALLGLVTSLNGFFLASTRVLFSAGRGGLIPAWFGRLNQKYRTPVNAILFVGLFAMIGPFLGKAILSPIVHAGSFAFVSVWFVTCLCAIRIRRCFPDLRRPYRVKHTVTLYFGAVVALGLALFFVVPGSPETLAWPHEVVIIVAWILLGLVFYLLRQRSNDMSDADRDERILGEYR